MAFQIQSHTAREVFRKLLNDVRIGPRLEQLQVHHSESHAHSLRVGLLCIDLGIENQLEENWLSILGCAALLHDIGKLRIPARLLAKPGPLTPWESRRLRAHPRLGLQELGDFKPAEVLEIVAAHHDYAPNPYPRRGKRGSPEDHQMRGARLGDLIQIVAAADIFDALRYRRAYKEALECSDAVAALRTQYLGNPQFAEQVVARCY